MGLDGDSEVQTGIGGRSEEANSRAMPGETGTHAGTLPGTGGNSRELRENIGETTLANSRREPNSPATAYGATECTDIMGGMVPGGTWLRSRL